MLDHTMTLADGRTLGWASLGAEDGDVVLVHNHGTPSSRLELGAFDGALADLGITVIAPDRPGYGLSSPRRDGRTVAGWVDDVAALIDHIGVGALAVSGYSGGGPHAVAIAASPVLGERVTHVVLVAAVQEGVATPGEEPMWEQARALDLPAFEAAFAGEALPELGAADMDALAEPTFGAAMTMTLVEGMTQGQAGAAADEHAFAHPWGVDHEAVTQPVDLWQGDADTIVPLDHIRLLAGTYPHATTHVVEGHGHISIVSLIPDILRPLAG